MDTLFHNDILAGIIDFDNGLINNNQSSLTSCYLRRQSMGLGFAADINDLVDVDISKIVAVLPRVWLGDGSVATYETLQEGDLVEINLKSTWPCNNPPPGLLVGIKKNSILGYVVVMYLPAGLLDSNAVGSRCSQEKKMFRVDDVDYIQFLARGATATFILFHNFIGKLSADKKDFLGRFKQIKDLLPWIP